MDECVVTMSLSTRYSGERSAREVMSFSKAIKPNTDGSINSEDIENAVDILTAKVNYVLLNPKAKHGLLE
jgi:hypothetical protein